jgi:PhnB protein
MATKTARKKTAARKTVAKKKHLARKPVARKPATRKPAPRKPAPRKAVKKKAVTKKAVAKRAAAKKPARPRTTRHGGPVGWPQLSLYMTVRDANVSVKFYEAAFGFKLTGETMKDAAGRIQHAGMRLGDAAIMFAPEDPQNAMRAPVTSGATDSLTLYIYVADVDALARRATRAGATLIQAPADQFWGDRIAVFKCPDGYHWTFATHVSEFDPSKIPTG